MTDFRSKEISLRVQKKLASKMSTKTVAKAFVDDTTSNLLDNLYRLCKNATGDKKGAEKMIKNIIKIVVKIGILNRNEQFNHDELVEAAKFQKKFHLSCMTIISFYEIDFSYDRMFIVNTLTECHRMLKNLIERHLTDKTITRVDNVFEYFNNPELLDSIFKHNSPHKEQLGKIIADLNTVLDLEESSASSSS